MKQPLPVTIEFKPLETSETEDRIQLAYNRIFAIASQNISKRELIKKTDE